MSDAWVWCRPVVKEAWAIALLRALLRAQPLPRERGCAPRRWRRPHGAAESSQ